MVIIESTLIYARAESQSEKEAMERANQQLDKVHSIPSGNAEEMSQLHA